MNYPFYISRRISPGGDEGKNVPAVKVAVAAVALSVAVMLASIAIVAGFKQQITAKIIGFNSHISIYALPQSDDDDNLVSLTPSLRKVLDDTPYITDYSLQASVPAIFKTDSDFQGIYLKSLEGAGIRNFISSNLTAGKLPDYSADDKKSELQLVISEITASRLGLKVGDRIDTYFLTGNVRVRPLRITGIFNSHFDTYDKVYAYGSLALIQQMGGLRPDQGTGIAVNTDNFELLPEYTSQLGNTLMDALANGLIYRPLRLDNALTQGAGYFQWLSLLDTNVVVVLTLMTFVAIVTLISGLLIIILDKKRFIGLLRALGAPANKVRGIFVYLALKVTVTGMIIGNAVMLLLLWLQDKYHFLHLDAESYYIDFVPVHLGWLPVLLLNAGVVVVVYFCLILPSWMVAKISPAETLRSE